MKNLINSFSILFLINCINASKPSTSLRMKTIKNKYRKESVSSIRKRVLPILKKELLSKDLVFGAQVFVRIFKESNEFELWIKSKKKFKLFKIYKICSWNGELGPKLREGDGQSSEGFYWVTKKRLNPWSSYHLSFNLGFPNRYDRNHNRTGSYLMVHGDCVSIAPGFWKVGT